MARTAVATLIVILAIHSSGLSQGKTPQDDALATVQTFVRANETANLDLIVSTFDEGATVFFPGGRPQRASGKGEIREVFAELFKQRPNHHHASRRERSVTWRCRHCHGPLESTTGEPDSGADSIPAANIRGSTCRGPLADRSSSRVECRLGTSTTVIVSIRRLTRRWT
jgi:hypothetical protein